MEFEEFVPYLEKLESTDSRLQMTDIVEDLLLQSEEDLPRVVLFVQGKLFPSWSPREIRIAEKMMVKCISQATGHDSKRIRNSIAEEGDAGEASVKLFQERTQTTLTHRTLSLERLEETVNKISQMEGTGSQERKTKHIVELLNSVQPEEVKYLVRLLLGEMRLGVGEGIMRDSIAQAWELEPEIVEHAFSLNNDYREVAEAARKGGKKEVEKIGLKLGRPIRPMLAQSVKTVEEAFESFKPAAFEYKYDGMRAQIHVFNDEIKVFTRRLDEVTEQFPDVVESVGKAVDADSAIIEGEVVAIDEEGRPRPFQFLSRRIKRKYDIQKMTREIPVITELFDCVYLNGENLIKTPFKQRRNKLESAVEETERLHLSKWLVSGEVKAAEKFYHQALEKGHEGAMIKNLEAEYKPGSRVGYMYKLKPEAETLDLVVVGAFKGEGRRAEWLGSYLLACRNPDTGEFLEIGRMATGLTDEQLEDLTQRLQEKIIEKHGKKVKLKPELVLEVGYQEIQKSPTYSSGYALRFPRLVRIREDKSPEEAETLERVGKLAKK